MVVNTKEFLGYESLQYAVAAGNWTAASLLLQFGADANTRDHMGRTTLHHAVVQMTAVDQLLKRGATPNVQDDQGDTLST